MMIHYANGDPIPEFLNSHDEPSGATFVFGDGGGIATTREPIMILRATNHLPLPNMAGFTMDTQLLMHVDFALTAGTFLQVPSGVTSTTFW